MQLRVTQGKFGHKNSSSYQTCPFEKLSLKELMEELKSRNVNLEYTRATK